MVDYVELRAHSAFSFGDGACTPETLVEVAARRGYGALGLTDRSDLGGAIRFALAARRASMRPVVGAELVVDGHPLALLSRSAEGPAGPGRGRDGRRAATPRPARKR
ncbi:MAG: PHP domain-containing protein [Candidatus Longimicrobiales bacterium M2_2A_002]